MKCDIEEQVTLSPLPLAFVQTADLIAELRRRALGCLILTVRAEECDGDVWLSGIKGSPMLIGAMYAALQIQTQAFLEEEQRPGVAAC